MDMTGDELVPKYGGPGLRELLERRVMKVPISEDRALFEQASPTRQRAPHGRNDTLLACRSSTGLLERRSSWRLAQHAFDCEGHHRELP